MKKIAVFIFLIFILFGCSEPTLERLNTPQNLVFMDAIYFEGVKHATSYVLEINGEEVVIDDVHYHIAEEGTYNVRVKAIAFGYDDSPYSQMITFIIDHTFEVPTSITINNNRILMWDVMTGAIKYLVLVNGESYETLENYFSLTQFEMSPLVINVKAIYNQGESIWSNRIIDEEGVQPIDLIQFNYSTNSSFDLIVLISESLLYIKESSTDAYINEYDFLENEVSIDTEYLTLLSLGEHEFKILTFDGYYVLRINIIDTNSPYMITSQEIYTLFDKDIICSFDLFDGTIMDLTGSSITPLDFIIVDNIVIINIDYVLTQFEEDHNLFTVTLTYTLQKGDEVITGDIDISPKPLPTL